eukprot:g8748.t1
MRIGKLCPMQLSRIGFNKNARYSVGRIRPFLHSAFTTLPRVPLKRSSIILKASLEDDDSKDEEITNSSDKEEIKSTSNDEEVTNSSNDEEEIKSTSNDEEVTNSSNDEEAKANSSDEEDTDEDEDETPVVTSSFFQSKEEKEEEEEEESKPIEREEEEQEEQENASFEKLILSGGDFDDLDAEWKVLNKKLRPIRKSYYDGSAYNSHELPPTPIKKLEEFPYDPLPEFKMLLGDLLEEAQMMKEAMEVKEKYGEVVLTGLQSQAKRVRKGDLYFARVTNEYDGIAAIPTAIENGAIAIIASDENVTSQDLLLSARTNDENKGSQNDVFSEQDASTNQIAFLTVSSINEVMGRLGCIFYDYPSSKMKIIAICGTRGKTSVAWILRSILHEFGASTGMMSDTEYSINHDLLDVDGEIFVPDEEDPAYHRVAATPYHLLPFKGRYMAPEAVPDPLQVQRVLAGIAHRGAQACVIECPLASIADLRLNNIDFDLALFLNLEREPDDTDEIFEAKCSLSGAIFSELDTPEAQRAIVNIDDENAQVILDKSKEVPVVTFSLNDPQADVWTESVSYTIWESEMIIVTPLGKMQIITPLIGVAHVYNILASVAASISVDISLPQIVAGIESLDAIPGRCQVVDEGQEFSVVIDNADTPQRLKSLIQNIRSCTPKRMFLVFGATQYHSREVRAELGNVAYYEADIVLITTDSPGWESPDTVISDIVAGFPRDLLEKYELWVMSPWQDPGRVPWWFEQWLFQAQNEVGRHIVEDRGLAIRGAIGTARKGDIVLITGRGSRDFSLWLNKDEKPIWTWFDDKTEVEDALFKLPHLLKSQIVTDKLPWIEPKDTSDRKRHP